MVYTPPCVGGFHALLHQHLHLHLVPARVYDRGEYLTEAAERARRP